MGSDRADGGANGEALRRGQLDEREFVAIADSVAKGRFPGQAGRVLAHAPEALRQVHKVAPRRRLSCRRGRDRGHRGSGGCSSGRAAGCTVVAPAPGSLDQENNQENKWKEGDYSAANRPPDHHTLILRFCYARGWARPYTSRTCSLVRCV